MLFLPMMGVTTTSHHFCVPVDVAHGPWKRPVPPALAASIALSASSPARLLQRSDQLRPSTVLKSGTSMARMPPWLMKRSRPFRSKTLMQSSELASSRRENSSLSATALLASFNSS